MRLADFILENRELILQEWESFARTILPAASSMNSGELRDHAEQMLIAVATDLGTTQTVAAQILKSHGLGPREREDTAAETHALTRLVSGFTIEQMVSEYRALRSSVLRLWSERIRDGAEFELEDMTRFNEAIDQALAESVVRYSAKINESQHIFLGILGHDLRTPLGAIQLGSEVMVQAEDLGSRYKTIASRIYSSVGRASSIVASLLDFTRSHFGGGIPVHRTEVELTKTCERIVEEVRAYHPERDIRLEAEANLIGQFDAERMEQVFCNLVENAIKHGANAGIVRVSLTSHEGAAQFLVHNEGEPINPRDLPHIFNPTTRFTQLQAGEHGIQAGLGLGLYIAHEIVTAHGGSIVINSTREHGTTFRVTLPFA